MKAPLIPVSWGELLDKIAILEIKRERIRSPAARTNVERELAALNQAAAAVSAAGKSLDELRAGLKQINETLWDIEDAIREKESRAEFDEAFIVLARDVYKSNDERARLKRAINDLLGSDLTEEKQYVSLSPDRGRGPG